LLVMSALVGKVLICGGIHELDLIFFCPATLVVEDNNLTG